MKPHVNINFKSQKKNTINQTETTLLKFVNLIQDKDAENHTFMNILITGISGFIGSHLAEHLLSLGHKVKGLDNLTDFYSRPLKLINTNILQSKGIEIIDLDLSRDDIHESLQDIEVIFHFAAQTGLSPKTSFNTYLRNNVIATQKLIKSFSSSTFLKLFVNISSSSVYGFNAIGSEDAETKPVSIYGVTKLAAEQLALSYVRTKHVPVCSLRLFSVYGPRERSDKLFIKLIHCALENKEFSLFDGSDKHLRAYTFVGDVVKGCALVLENIDKCVGEIFNIGSELSITTATGIMIIEKILGRRIKTIIKPKRQGDQITTKAFIEKARKNLIYNPNTQLYDGLEKEVEWYMSHIHNKVRLPM